MRMCNDSNITPMRLLIERMPGDHAYTDVIAVLCICMCVQVCIALCEHEV